MGVADYSGASLGFQIGAAISGGLTPFAAANNSEYHGAPTAFASCELGRRWQGCQWLRC